jgi:3-isopropylmalate/(R)-2-methylmalate dehydratase small subunit
LIATTIKGKAHVYGDNIDTDAIIPGKYTKSLDLRIFADHVLEDLDPEFKAKVRKGDILVAGKNFGCGSSREQAPLALKAAGISTIVATYFARIFFRNAINIGLAVLEVDHSNIVTGDELAIELKAGLVKNLSNETSYTANRMPQIMIDILEEEGLVKYLRKNGDYLLEGI